MKTATIAFLFLPITTKSFFQIPDDLKRRFDEAERTIMRLPPSAVRQLPRNVVRELQHRGCTIPQTSSTRNQHNVIRGEFAKPGQTDWAILCSVKGVSSILVFWNGSEKNPAEIASVEDRIFLQGIAPEQIGFPERSTRLGRSSFCATMKPTEGRSRRQSTILELTMLFLKGLPRSGISTPGSG